MKASILTVVLISLIFIYVSLSFSVTSIPKKFSTIRNVDLSSRRSKKLLLYSPLKTLRDQLGPIYSNSDKSYSMTNKESPSLGNQAQLSNHSNVEQLSLGLSQLRPFLNIAVPFFQQDQTARNSLITVSALTLLNSGVSVAFSYISRDFYNALNARDESLFYEKIELFFIALCIAVPISVYYRFVREKLSLYWREALTAKALQRYYSNRTFYIIEMLREVDNPDQRISEDIRRFTDTSLDFFIAILTSVIDLMSFSAILFQIYPPLFLAIIGYAGVGTLITTKLGQSLVSLNYDRLQREANFRFSLFRVRENAESIAFYDSDVLLEQENSWKMFQKALETQLGTAIVKRNLEFFTTSYRYIVQILPSLIVAPLYFAKKVELGTINQSYGAFNHILGDFSIIINSFESLSAFSAGLTRLARFFDAINEQGWGKVNAYDSPGTDEFLKLLLSSKNSKPIITLNSDSALPQPALLRCQNLTIFTPDFTRVVLGNITTSNSPGIQGANVDINRGDKVLVVGPSGCGKSSFVRAIAGLWQVGFGNIEWDQSLSTSKSDPTRSPNKVFFLPQRPYNVMGDLRSQIMYPSTPRNADRLSNDTIYSNIRVGKSSLQIQDQEKDVTSTLEMSDSVEKEMENDDDDALFLKLLDRVKLGNLAARMGNGNARAGLRCEKDWGKILSIGEQQRLAFARVLYNEPDVLVLDEATSALDLVSEQTMYNLLQEENITYISVGHRPSLLRYHNEKLVLGVPGEAPSKMQINKDALDLTAELVDLSSIA